MRSLCTPQCVLQPPSFKHLIISPPISGFWAAGAFGSSRCVWYSHVFGHGVSGFWGCGAFSVCCRVFYCCHRVCHRVCCTPSTSQSDGQKVRAKPSRLDTLKNTKQPCVLKKVTIAQRVEKCGKYGLYDNNGRLYCKPRGKKMDETLEDSLMKHVVCAKHIQFLFFVLLLIVLRGNRSAYCWCCAGLGANRPTCI